MFKDITHISFFVAAITIILLPATVFAASPSFCTRPWNGHIRTLQIRYAGGHEVERPVLVLGGEEQLEISFDELSHEGRNYSYKITHCNADWTPSDLFSGEYLRGFTTGDITDYSTSLNTSVNYTHYRFCIPNDDMQLTRSGNYAVTIYEDNDPDNKIVATACFSIVEPHIGISANVRSQTDIEFNNRYQQLDITLNTGNYYMRDPMSEISVVIRQNGRLDNAVTLTRPSAAGLGTLKYEHIPQMIFEAGNQFRRFDIPSLHLLGTGVDDLDFYDGNYHALLITAENMSRMPFREDWDANGQFVINAERVSDIDTESEYVWVHMFMPAAVPYIDGQLYVCGDLSYNLMTRANQMLYDNEMKGYAFTGLYKQGGYDFQILFEPTTEKGTIPATTLRTEGSHWQTHNEYAIYVYHKPWGERYDKLVGYQVIR
ncbi:MAG: DUF5103 domain-containing protein [Paludibacteraceae bacterium]|nr:DUF5103 domain-containing protein [Paludibacteraceae bacterium]